MALDTKDCLLYILAVFCLHHVLHHFVTSHRFINPMEKRHYGSVEIEHQEESYGNGKKLKKMEQK